MHHGNTLSNLYAEHTAICCDYLCFLCCTFGDIYKDLFLFVCFLRNTKFSHTHTFHFSLFTLAGQHTAWWWLCNYGNKSDVCSPFGFNVKSNNCLHPTCTCILSRNTVVSTPIQPANDETFPGRGKCVCLRSFRFIQ